MLSHHHYGHTPAHMCTHTHEHTCSKCTHAHICTHAGNTHMHRNMHVQPVERGPALARSLNRCCSLSGQASACASTLRWKLMPAPGIFMQFGEPTGKHACTCMQTLSSRLLTLSQLEGQYLYLHHLDKAGFVPIVTPVTLATEGHSVLWAQAPLMVSWPAYGSQTQSPEHPVEAHAQRSLWPFQCLTTGLCAPRALTI